MKNIIAILIIMFNQPASANMNAAIDALMDEDKIEYLSTRGTENEPTLVIGLKDNGNSRDGYAEYICIVLNEKNAAKNILIKVIDVDIFNNQQREKMIGSYICNHD
tara:strand:- start:53 stop:370 length:318 start_codon:yes stop_codon:yes gene_type:complete